MGKTRASQNASQLGVRWTPSAHLETKTQGRNIGHLLVKLTRMSSGCNIDRMKTLPVGEIKAQFSEVLEKVKQGESFGILYGKRKRPVAMLVPYIDSEKKAPRQIGIMDGKVSISFSSDSKMTEDELLGL